MMVRTMMMWSGRMIIEHLVSVMKMRMMTTTTMTISPRYEVCRVPLIIAPNVPSIRGELALQCVAHPPKKLRVFLYNTTHDTNIDFNMAHLVLLLTLWYILKFRVFNLGFLPFNFEGRAKSQESP